MVWLLQVLPRPQPRLGSRSPDPRHPAAKGVNCYPCRLGNYHRRGLALRPIRMWEPAPAIPRDARNDDPALLLSQRGFTRVPYAPTLEAQCVIKNMVLISAGIVLGATVRGGRIVANPKSGPRQPEARRHGARKACRPGDYNPNMRPNNGLGPNRRAGHSDGAWIAHQADGGPGSGSPLPPGSIA